MWRKIILGILLVEIILSWPISMIKKPIKIDLETIFYPITQGEKLEFQKKLALDSSQIKKFYYNKTTIFKERYLKNLLVLADLNNYFFIMHPREDISGVDYRFKYPFWAIIFLIVAIKVAVRDKKYFKIWLIILVGILILSFLKQVSSMDLILFFPITYLLYLGAKELNEYKGGWIFNLGLIFLMAIEIGRMWL